jgi:hypothetical protein
MAGLAWLIGAFECDEGCHGGGHWSVHEDAWQWDAIQLLSLGLLVTLTLFLVAILAGWLAAAWVLFALQAMGAAAVTALVVSSGMDPQGVLFVVAAALRDRRSGLASAPAWTA